MLLSPTCRRLNETRTRELLSRIYGGWYVHAHGSGWIPLRRSSACVPKKQKINRHTPSFGFAI